MTATQHSLKLLREHLKAQGGHPVWVATGTYGRLECWLLASELRIVHGLPADGGVEVYAPIPAATFEELLAYLEVSHDAAESGSDAPAGATGAGPE